VISRILIAVDDEVFGDAIEDLLSQIKFDSSPTMRVVHVVEPMEAMAAWPSEQYREEALSLISRIATNLRKHFPDHTVEDHLLQGYITDEIIDEAINWKADLIVVGSHGRRGIRRFSLGSVSQQIVSNAPCSVVLVRQLSRGETSNAATGARSSKIARG